MTTTRLRLFAVVGVVALVAQRGRLGARRAARRPAALGLVEVRRELRLVGLGIAATQGGGLGARRAARGLVLAHRFDPFRFSPLTERTSSAGAFSACVVRSSILACTSTSSPACLK